VPPGPECIIEDDGTGTVALPPEGPGCPDGYISPEDVHLMDRGTSASVPG